MLITFIKKYVRLTQFFLCVSCMTTYAEYQIKEKNIMNYEHTLVLVTIMSKYMKFKCLEV